MGSSLLNHKISFPPYESEYNNTMLYNKNMKKYPIWYWLVLSISILLLSIGLPKEAVNAQNNTHVEAILLTFEGPLTPILNEYIIRGMRIAEERQAELIILQINTPGGSIDIMNDIVQQIRSSQIPVIVYVSPRGAMAASAGTIITLAGHVAAMAPETTIGAASPVGSQGEDIESTLESKTKEILKATVRAIASKRKPEAIKLAEETIDQAKAVSVQEALTIGLVDLEANDVEDLLQKLNGRTITINGQESILNTDDATTYPVENSLIEEMLQLLTNPNLVFLLLSIGVQAILIELSSPGGWVAGFIGAICVMLAIYGMGVLPINWFGILFIITAFVLFFVDIKAPTHGALTAAGAGSFIVGALILFNSIDVPGFPKVSVPLVIGTGIAIAASFSIIVTFAIRAQHIPVKTGRETLPGQTGIVVTKLDPTGQVHVAGELWSAELVKGEQPLERGEKIKVISIKGLTLMVGKGE